MIQNDKNGVFCDLFPEERWVKQINMDIGSKSEAEGAATEDDCIKGVTQINMQKDGRLKKQITILPDKNITKILIII